MIVFRLGRMRAPQGPGVVLLLPFIDHWQRVDMRTRAFNVPPCKVTSVDGAVISVGADIQFRVWNPVLSVMMVKDLNTAARMTAQNAMTKTLLKKNLREIQTEKARIGDQLLLEINDVIKSWGLEVDRVELILEAVLQPPQESLSGPHTIHQLAIHFFGTGRASASLSGTSGTADNVKTVSEIQQGGPLITTTTSSSNVKIPSTEELLSTLETFLSESLVNQVRACYQFNILLPSRVQSMYFIDLSEGHGKVGHGMPEHSPDVVLEMTEEDLQALFMGNLRPLNAYMSGRLRVRGDLNLALKLEEIFRMMNT
uniref:Stomatin-like protein 1 n=1 Tax=Sphenodon punctatus TaxID=8508 RepID=A0A8D0GM56_SPHPU